MVTGEPKEPSRFAVDARLVGDARCKMFVEAQTVTRCCWCRSWVGEVMTFGK